MSKGRPRKNVPRTPSGQIKKATSGADGLYHPSAVKRIAEAAIHGIGQDPRWGTTIGRLYLEGKMTAVQFEAGKRWDELARRYHKAMGSPAPSPRSCSTEMVPRAVDADIMTEEGCRLDERDALVVKTYDDAHHVLCVCGVLIEKAVRDAVEKEEWPANYTGLRALQAGLDALGVYWQLAKK